MESADKPTNESVPEFLRPSRSKFAADPLGYSVSAWHLWGLAKEVAGFPVDLAAGPQGDDLRSPVLWLTHAHAMSAAAERVLLSEPEFEFMPAAVRGVCDAQYCAVGLMLVGYSLETCLKAMLILQKGAERYGSEERSHRHHRLEELANFVPDLTDKDRAILRALTHFTSWAGRYPDPGVGRNEMVEEVFAISEGFRVSGSDLFRLSRQILAHVADIVG